VAGGLGQPHFCVTVLMTRHAGTGQVRHWLVVAVIVGQPVGCVGGAVVWWSPVATTGATLREGGQQGLREIGRRLTGVSRHLHGSPEGKEYCKRVHLDPNECQVER
jgi:hypothetical protein